MHGDPSSIASLHEPSSIGKITPIWGPNMAGGSVEPLHCGAPVSPPAGCLAAHAWLVSEVAQHPGVPRHRPAGRLGRLGIHVLDLQGLVAPLKPHTYCYWSKGHPSELLDTPKLATQNMLGMWLSGLLLSWSPSAQDTWQSALSTHADSTWQTPRLCLCANRRSIHMRIFIS